jgi:feruloyl esterase
MVTAFGKNYAVKSTDLGHISKSGLLAADGVTVVPQGTDGSWALGHPEKIIDWGYRAEHVTTVASKGIVQAYYDSAPRYSYFEGCSSGGHVGSMDASRYPDDFNGVISGAPNWYWTGMATGRLWSSIPSLKDRAAGDAFVTKLPALHSAVVAACDGLDGLKDGLVDDPRKCNFDPSTMQCPAGTDALTCLTPAQVTMAKIINGGPQRPNGQQLWPGFTWSGEAKWGGSVAGGATPGGSSFDFFRYWVWQDPKYDNKTFNFDSDFDFTNNKEVAPGQTMDSVVNVKPEGINTFGAHGGKMLMYHGWADDQVQVLGTIPFYNRVMAANNNAKPDAFYRLFLVPGMQHCSGGDGPDSFDKLAALENWVEKGIAPDQIIASKIVSGKVTRTRPLCPYPQVAKYNGTGSIDDAANFACTNPS